MYELMVDIDDCTANDEVIVRAWIDHLQSGELTSEVELALSKQGVNKWRAVFDVADSEDDDSFAYRVGLIARPGAAWSLRIRECNNSADESRTLVEDGDVLTTRKEWLLGTCDTPR